MKCAIVYDVIRSSAFQKYFTRLFITLILNYKKWQIVSKYRVDMHARCRAQQNRIFLALEGFLMLPFRFFRKQNDGQFIFILSAIHRILLPCMSVCFRVCMCGVFVSIDIRSCDG